jgi:two-component system, LytTR family, response regulator
VKTSDIIYAESNNSYTTFYLLNQSKILVSKSIKEFEILLHAYGFIRVHQSFLVNKEMIIGLDKKDGLALKLQNGVEVPLSKNKKVEVLAILGF